MRPLRFCMLTTFYPPYHFGGDAIGIQRLSRALVRRGHEVTVVHDIDAYELLAGGREPGPSEEPAGLRVIGLRTERGFWTELLTQQTGRPVVNRKRIQAILDEGEFDVINYHNVSLVGGPGLFAMGDAVKLYMAHEHWLVCPMHVLWKNGRERCEEKSCLSCTLSYKRPPQWWRWTGLLEREARHVDRFIAMSEFSRKKHADFGFGPTMQVLPYFLPDPEPGERPGSGASPHERPYFLFVGRLEKIKGLDDVLPLFRSFEGADLLIAGDGDYAPTLKSIAEGIDRVHFLGRVDLEELRRYYDHALALIVPSVCFETFGIILIESFRQRTPVIARRIGPLPEIVERAQGGLLFENASELKSALQTMLQDDEARERMAQSAYDAYLEHWTESAVLPRYLDLVRDVARETGRDSVVDALT